MTILINLIQCSFVFYFFIFYFFFFSRNRLGASGVCPEISKSLISHISDKNIVFELIKCIGNLAANNPNNQTKLGLSGCCEILCEIMKSLLPINLVNTVLLDKNEFLFNGNMVKWLFWSLGNIMQIGKNFYFFIFVFILLLSLLLI